MIKIVAKNTVTEGNAPLFKEMAKPLIEGSKKEKGCISYDLYEDIDDPNILTFIEEWVDLDAIAGHVKTDHYTKIIPELTKLHAFPKEVRKYKIVE